MIIKSVRFARLSVPLHTPFKTALRTVSSIEDLVVIIDTQCGKRGYGCAPSTPVITGDTHQSIISIINTVLAPQLINQDVRNINALCDRLAAAVVANSSAKAALEIALYDLWAQGLGVPLYRALGGNQSELKTDVTISVDAIDKMLSDCDIALAKGFDVLKIKIGNDLEQDIQRVRAIARHVGNKAALRLDVNQGWDAKQAVRALQAIESEGIVLELVEQPVKANDVDGLEYISARVQSKIMADESAFSPRQVITLLERGAVDIINIKLMKSGGISRALRIADIAATYERPCMIGCMLEGSIAVAAAAHLAAAKARQIGLIDLDGPALGQYDPVQGGTRFCGPAITLNTGPGLGITGIEGLIELPNGVWQ
ncbi:dipeptide epimerase [Pseudoalteromonas sp. YIC-827]|uniref:Dipeptide epimerase n=1 Tax=Pseudoalteromonas qingdaonensis TaxID=3131913 RepID=A0ABU9N2E6_9GAMM